MMINEQLNVLAGVDDDVPSRSLFSCWQHKNKQKADRKQKNDYSIAL